MNTVSSLIDTLNSFETPEAIAEFLMSKEVKGRVQDSESCVISNWILTETGGESCATTEECIYVSIDGEASNYILTNTVAQFIAQFDDWEYPDLIIDYDPYPWDNDL